MAVFSKQMIDLLQRVSTWPEEWQQRLLGLVIELEAEMANEPYTASSVELRQIDQGLEEEAASQEEIKSAYAKLQRS